MSLFEGGRSPATAALQTHSHYIIHNYERFSAK